MGLRISDCFLVSVGGVKLKLSAGRGAKVVASSQGRLSRTREMRSINTYFVSVEVCMKAEPVNKIPGANSPKPSDLPGPSVQRLRIVDVKQLMGMESRPLFVHVSCDSVGILPSQAWCSISFR